MKTDQPNLLPDFVSLVGDLTNFVQNERVRAYNEGVDDMLAAARAWIREHKLDPIGDNLPDMLDDFLAQYKTYSWNDKNG